MLNTNSKEGIQGQITSLGHEPHQYVTFYIQVDDINATLKKIEEAGGKKIVGPVPLPNKTQFAWFKDPEGNMVALVTKEGSLANWPISQLANEPIVLLRDS
jgi:predicted enzyme related to lactoylglutathione lyase